MARIELAETLLALVESVEPPAGTGLTVVEVELDVPLEVHNELRAGRLTFYASVPHSRWRTGVLPPVHASHLRVVALSADLGGAERAGGRGGR